MSCHVVITNSFFLFYRQDRVNIIPTTRTSTGKLPLPRQLDLPDSSSNNRVYVNQRIASGDVKEKMEQQLRAQREANNKKRAEELKQGKYIKRFCKFSDLLQIPTLPQANHNSRRSSEKFWCEILTERRES
jgi:negative regulator of genetic competence, sporulation and motility